MRKTIALCSIAAFVALTCSQPVGAADADNKDVMVPIHQFIDGINTNDMKSAAAAFTAQASIIDEFPPHHWMGTTAFADWGAAFGEDSKKNAVSEPFMKLLAARLVRVEADHAYVVQNALYTFKQRGKKQRERGQFTYALDRSDAGWRIASWAWAVE